MTSAPQQRALLLLLIRPAMKALRLYAGPTARAHITEHGLSPADACASSPARRAGPRT